MNNEINFISFQSKTRIPLETPIWIMQEGGKISIGALHNNGCGCSGVATCKVVDSKKGTIQINSDEFLIKSIYWAPIESMEQVVKVLGIKEG